MAEHSNDTDTDKLPCADKLVFDTRKQAAVSANILRYRHGILLRPYVCPHCHLWHLSTDRGEE